MGPTWGPPESCRPQIGPILAPWTLLSQVLSIWSEEMLFYGAVNQQRWIPHPMHFLMLGMNDDMSWWNTEVMNNVHHSFAIGYILYICNSNIRICRRVQLGNFTDVRQTKTELTCNKLKNYLFHCKSYIDTKRNGETTMFWVISPLQIMDSQYAYYRPSQ